MRTAVLLTVCCVFALRFDAAAQQPSDSQKVILTYPVNGDTFTVGDTLTVQWVTTDQIVSVDIRISPDAGKTWILVNGTSIPYYDTARWGHFKWVIPESIRENPPDTNVFTLADNHSCLIRVENYSPKDNSEISISPKPVVILGRSGVLVPDRKAVQTPAFNLNAILSRGASSLERNTAIRFFDVRGRAVSVRKRVASGLILGVFPSRDAHPVRETEKAAYIRQR